ncbi:hypothetical protein [Carnobacterium maltaromaticum]|uniref:hypothetical protein n=1 Tax=Carnobacterium maltaromaticum TaxID=2751 RepID=UPI001DB28EDE|nr:hypothetical protein [Carnobacterium maltaromaticum]MCC4311775.1 hypothetical protein [Carnobacterium maltaromaticum]
MSKGRHLYQRINSLAGYMIIVQVFATAAILVGGFYIDGQIGYGVNMTAFVVKAVVQSGASIFVLVKQMEEPSLIKALFVLILAFGIGWTRYSVMLATSFYVSFGLSGIALVIMAIVLLVFQINYEQYQEKS